MNYEEKLRLAKEALESGSYDKDTIEYIFPELKESEDERIRKALIDFFNRGAENGEQTNGVCDKDILAWLEKQKEPEDKGEISDGYHTFNELYYYRMLYNAAFFNMLPKELVHKSKKHNDGEECFGGGWFIVMANLPTGQISNHYELKDWDLFNVPEKETADKWDGHTPQEAADRLYKYLLESKTNAVPKSHDEDKRFVNILQNIVKGACSKYGIKWKGVDTSEKDLLDWIETHIYTEEDLTNAYECADQVQYKIGYDDAKKRIEEKLCWCQGDDDMVAAALKFAHEYGRHGLWYWLKSLKQRIGVQDYQKSADKAVSMFNVGDWVVRKDEARFYNGMRAVQITNIDGWGRCWFDYSTWISTKEIRLWTLKDARDGDVLADNKRPFIFKGFLDISHPNHPVAYCGINTLGSFISGSGSNWWTNNKDDVKPATKEERELLYREMEKDGYEWNKITKELKKKSS